MSDTQLPSSQPFRDTIQALTQLFSEFGGRGVIVGGVAVGFASKPRATKDLDAMLVYDTGKSEELLRAAIRHGFKPSFSDMAEFAQQQRMLVLDYLPTGIRVDIALGCMPFEEEIEERAITFRDKDLVVRIPSPEDLIIMKAIAHRDQDLADIRQVARHHPAIDQRRIETWPREYGVLLETPNLWADVQPLLQAAD